MDGIFNIVMFIFVLIIGIYAYSLNRKLSNLSHLIHVKEMHTEHKRNYLEHVSGTKRDLLGYLVTKYFNGNDTELINTVDVSDYDMISYLLDQMARPVGLTYIEASTCLMFESGHHHATGDAKRFVKLLKTVRGAITNRPVRIGFVFDYDVMTDKEKELVIAILSSNSIFTVSYTNKKDTGENKIEIKSTLQFNDARLYQLYKDIVSEYRKLLGRNGIMHPAIVPTTVTNRDLLFSLSIKKGNGDFIPVAYPPDVIVGFLTAYAMIEKKPIYAFCKGNYPLALHIYNIVYQEKRKTTLKAIAKVK